MTTTAHSAAPTARPRGAPHSQPDLVGALAMLDPRTAPAMLLRAPMIAAIGTWRRSRAELVSPVAAITAAAGSEVASAR